MFKELICMIEQFPEFQERIYELFRNSSDFRVLCEDYLYTKESLSNSTEFVLENKQIENEFRALCTSLEQEALRYLQSDRDQ